MNMRHRCLQGELFLAKVLKPFLACQSQKAPPMASQQPSSYIFGATVTPEKGIIPKIIWAYWSGSDMPLFVQKCLQNWYRMNPGYAIHILDAQTLTRFIDKKNIPEGLEQITEQKKSDWLRLQLLHQYGGIWIDASTVLTQSLDWVLREQEKYHCDFLGFYLDKFTSNPQCPVVESWFMAAPPQNRFIGALLNEFAGNAIHSDGSIYVNHLKNIGIFDTVAQRIDGPDYLNIHLCIQRVLQRSDACYSLALLKAEDTAFWFHYLAHWNRVKLRAGLLLKKAPETSPAIVKLRGPDRRKLDDYFRAGICSDGSFVGRYLMNATH
jgi:hypothetical protein